MLAIFQQTCDNSSMNVILTMYNIKMFSRNLSVPDFVRRFFVSCAQISEALALRPPLKFGCDWRKIGHKSRCRKDSERTLKIKGGTNGQN